MGIYLNEVQAGIASAGFLMIKKYKGVLMNRIGFLLTVITPLILYAQQYVEVSGQTQSFDLKAGAKAAWNNSSAAIHRPADAANQKPFSLVCPKIGETRRFVVNGQAIAGSHLCIYSVRGELVSRTSLTQNNTFILSEKLKNGYYAARIDNEARASYGTHFLMTR
jgi:hypothetical protein